MGEAKVKGDTSGIRCISTDGQVAVCGGDGGLFLWDYSIGGAESSVVKKFDSPHGSGAVTCVCLANDGRVLVSGSEDGQVAIGRKK
jgi:WD40 repeat protein